MINGSRVFLGWKNDVDGNGEDTECMVEQLLLFLSSLSLNVEHFKVPKLRFVICKNECMSDGSIDVNLMCFVIFDTFRN